MAKIELRGGTGNHISLSYRPCRRASRNSAEALREAAVAKARAAREERFDREAADEAAAIRGHRLLTPAREISRGRAH